MSMLRLAAPCLWLFACGGDAARPDAGPAPGCGEGPACGGDQTCVAGVCVDVPELLAPDRRIAWDPGVRGGIPARATVCATLAAGTDAAAIQAALDACAADGVVELAAGEFPLDATLSLPSGVTLRGDGAGSTILRGTAGFAGDALIAFSNGFDTEWRAPARALAPGTVTRGATTLTTSEAHGWEVGDVVLVDMRMQPDGDPPIENASTEGDCTWCGREAGERPVGQWVQVTAVPSGTTATIDPPLYWPYANDPRAVRMTGLTRRAGLEDLTLDNLTSGVDMQVVFEGAVDCWMSGVEQIGVMKRGVWVYGGLWLTIQGGRITAGVPIGSDGDDHYESDRAYGIFLGPHVSASLITDQVFDRLTLAVAFEGAASGNVYSYNLSTQMWWHDAGVGASVRFGPLMHGPHPMYNLLESNWSAGRFRADEYWGTSSHFVLLRNRIHQQARNAIGSQTWSIDVERRNWYFALLGNLLGEPGVEDTYQLDGESYPYEDGPRAVYRLGYAFLDESGATHDPMVAQTLVRHGNWVAFGADGQAGQEWEPSIASRLVPSSYYLTSSPATFAALAWPPFDPTAPMDRGPRRLPAGVRYCTAMPSDPICAE